MLRPREAEAYRKSARSETQHAVGDLSSQRPRSGGARMTSPGGPPDLPEKSGWRAAAWLPSRLQGVRLEAERRQQSASRDAGCSACTSSLQAATGRRRCDGSDLRLC